MITDKYMIDGLDSEAAAVAGLEKAGRFSGMDEAAQGRLDALGKTLLQLAQNLEKVSGTQLWMETKPGEAIVHLKADCAVDLKEEEELKELSSTGKNTWRKGFFDKIKGAFDEIAIADNEELNDLGYIPQLEYGSYNVIWTFAPDVPGQRKKWDSQAAAQLHCLADSVEVGFSSEQVEIAAHMKYSPVA